MPSTRRRRQAGFAFLLVLGAVVMLGLLLTSAAQVATLQQRRDRELELLSVGRQFRTAIQAYHDVGLPGGAARYPESFDDLLADRRGAGPVRHHLRKVFVDPLTGRPDWVLERVGGQIVGVHSASAERPLKQQGFEGEELGFNGAASYQDWRFAPQGTPAAPVAAPSAAPR